jgi:hypothetical protein
VNIRDKESAKNLYFIHRFLPASIAKLFGVSHVTILNIVNKNKDVSIVSDTECLLCGLDDCQNFYIDGNRSNKNPQNIIMLCEADRRRIRALQLRKRKGFIQPEFESGVL